MTSPSPACGTLSPQAGRGATKLALRECVALIHGHWRGERTSRPLWADETSAPLILAALSMLSPNRDLLEHIEHRVQIVDRDVAHVPDAEGRFFPLAVAAAERVAALLHL